MKILIQCDWDDVPHLDQQTKDDLYKSMPAHEREARSKGFPILGSGLIFPLAQSEVECEPFHIPEHYRRIGGIDFGGFDHPLAAAELAIDPDTDVTYVIRTYRKVGATIAENASALRTWDVPIWAWPHDGKQKERSTGRTTSQLYKDEGLKTLPEHATFPDGGNRVQPGIEMMYKDMFAKKLRIFTSCTEFFTEMRQYHRKAGDIIREDDDVISATRYAYMMKRAARQPPETRRNEPTQQVTRSRRGRLHGQQITHAPVSQIRV